MTDDKTLGTMALGTMYFGTRVDEKMAFAILDRFVEHGGQWLDTSNNYSFWTSDTGFGGQSEALLGRWLQSNPGAPVRLSTKVGAQPTRVGGFPDHLEGLGRDTVQASLDASLQRLGRDRVDLYWAHLEDPRVPIEDLVGTFSGLVSNGLIDRYGVSNHPSWLVERIRGAAERAEYVQPTAYQQRFSYYQPLPGCPSTAKRSRSACCPTTVVTSSGATRASQAGSTPRRCSVATTGTTGPCRRSTGTRAMTVDEPPWQPWRTRADSGSARSPLRG